MPGRFTRNSVSPAQGPPAMTTAARARWREICQNSKAHYNEATTEHYGVAISQILGDTPLQHTRSRSAPSSGWFSLPGQPAIHSLQTAVETNHQLDFWNDLTVFNDTIVLSVQAQDQLDIILGENSQGQSPPTTPITAPHQSTFHHLNDSILDVDIALENLESAITRGIVRAEAVPDFDHTNPRGATEAILSFLSDQGVAPRRAPQITLGFSSSSLTVQGASEKNQYQFTEALTQVNGIADLQQQAAVQFARLINNERPPPKTFHQYAKLPLELRHMILEASVEPRILRCYRTESLFATPYRLVNTFTKRPVKQPAWMLATKAFRDKGQQLFKRFLDNRPPTSKSGDESDEMALENGYLIHPKYDIIQLTGKIQTKRGAIEDLDAVYSGLESIEMVAIKWSVIKACHETAISYTMATKDTMDGWEASYTFFLDIATYFRGVKKIFVCDEQYYPGVYVLAFGEEDMEALRKQIAISEDQTIDENRAQNMDPGRSTWLKNMRPVKREKEMADYSPFQIGCCQSKIWASAKRGFSIPKEPVFRVLTDEQIVERDQENVKRKFIEKQKRSVFLQDPAVGVSVAMQAA